MLFDRGPSLKDWKSIESERLCQALVRLHLPGPSPFQDEGILRAEPHGLLIRLNGMADFSLMHKPCI